MKYWHVPHGKRHIKAPTFPVSMQNCTERKVKGLISGFRSAWLHRIVNNRYQFVLQWAIVTVIEIFPCLPSNRWRIPNFRGFIRKKLVFHLNLYCINKEKKRKKELVFQRELISLLRSYLWIDFSRLCVREVLHKGATSLTFDHSNREIKFQRKHVF